MTERMTRRTFLQEIGTLSAMALVPKAFDIPRPDEVLTENDVILGRDLGIPCLGTPLLLFGDTTSENVTHGGPHATDRMNTAAVFNGITATPINGDRQLWSNTDGLDSTPTGAIVLGDIYASYMDVYSNQGHWFGISSSGIVVSPDGGNTWKKHTLREGATNFSQSTPFPQPIDGYIYSFGTQGGRLSPAFLQRVPEGRILDLSSYEFWNSRSFVSKESAAVPVVNDTVGELSVSFNTALNAFLMMYMSPSKGNGGALVYTTAPQLWGPWSAPVIMEEWGTGGQTTSPWYGTYAPQQLSVHTGKTILFLYSHYDDYRVKRGKFLLP